ncbi:MarR family winged helix-turn-helix transcriptional regulator [Amycolatopsis sp. NPDC098790]|uniref:MarR family winged helix-turn-helix transcriptional regulator n=1 Tax=Amycolatopsis sp. NPDC098790 TaxID=3363939 RepID=UPI0038014BBE
MQRKAGAGGSPDETPESLAADEQELWRSLGRVVQRLPRVIDDDMVRASGLTMSEFAILDSLREAGESTLRITELAANTGLSHSRVSRMVDQLSGRGWCRRERDASDGRAALAVLTEEGKNRADDASAHHARIARRRFLAHVPPEARDSFRSILVAISDAGKES